jgi:agmatine deiminase
VVGLSANSKRKPGAKVNNAVAQHCPRQLGFRMPAEWEAHAATWLTWPSSEDWPGKLDAVRWACCEFIDALVQTEPVRLIVGSAAAKAAALRKLERAGVDVERIEFFIARTDRSWARDNLPTFVVNRERTQLGAVKWKFNGWARYADHRLDERAGLSVAQTFGAPCWRPQLRGTKGRGRFFVLEGGAIDVDGAGTLLTTKRCLLGKPYARNPGASKSEVERILGEYVGAEHVIWLDDGIAGDDTSGHVDDFARFASVGTVVLAVETKRSDANYAPLQRARQQLARARDARGNALQIVELPMPRPLTYDGERLPASYANFYIFNESVVVPTFNDPNDRIALSILADVFEGRTVRGVHALDLVVGLGTLHCASQQQPWVAGS